MRRLRALTTERRSESLAMCSRGGDGGGGGYGNDCGRSRGAHLFGLGSSDCDDDDDESESASVCIESWVRLARIIRASSKSNSFSGVGIRMGGGNTGGGSSSRGGGVAAASKTIGLVGSLVAIFIVSKMSAATTISVAGVDNVTAMGYAMGMADAEMAGRILVMRCVFFATRAAEIAGGIT